MSYRSSIPQDGATPLIFDTNSTEFGIETKTLYFYERSMYLPALYKQLSHQEKQTYCDGIKKLSVACEMGLLTKEEENILVQSSKNIDLFENIITANNLNISPYPTSIHRLPRLIDEELQNYETIKIKDKQFTMVFVDPTELSFHNLENIISMEYYFNKMNLKIKISDNSIYLPMQNKLDIFSINLSGCESLLDLNNDAFYTLPLNGNTRGGKRFIFQSSSLSNNLTKVVNRIKKKYKNFNNFHHVNTVFRLNKFRPGDDKFDYHYDTPFYDSKHKYYSKYTMVIYLTQGTSKSDNEPILLIKGNNEIAKIKNVNMGTCLLFNQKYEHQGNPMLDNDKIFIRTELIFKSQNPLNKDNKLKKRFSSACYLFKESLKDSIFSSEIAKHSNKYFNRVNRERFNLCNDKISDNVVIMKDCGYTTFCTNGCDYWFPIYDGKIIDQIKSMTIIAILDYFNGKIKDKNPLTSNFNCETVEIMKHTTETKLCETILDYDYYGFGCLKDAAADFDIDKAHGKKYTADKNECCPYHGYGFMAEKCKDIIDEVTQKRNLVKKQINECSVVIFDEVCVNAHDIVVNDKTITFKTTGMNTRINFASCWNCNETADDFINEIQGEGFRLPTIHYDEIYGCIHMVVDMFNNSFTTTTDINKYEIKDLD